jgi:hypothetical protein
MSVVAMTLCAALGVAGVRHTRGHGERHFLATQRYQDVYYLPPPGWLRVFSLGHDEALAGLIWLRALIYFGEELVHGGNVANLYRYADAMLALDPYFKKVYQWVGSAAIYRTGDVTVEDVRKAIRYLEAGVRHFPDDGELAWDLGAHYVYELPPLLAKPAEKAAARLRGVEHLRVAVLRGAGPPWLALSASTELAKLGHAEQEIRYLEELYPQIADPQIKIEVERRLTRLRSESYAEAMRRANQEFEQARSRDFPYLDPTLYLLVGPRPPFDGRALLLRGFDPDVETFASPTDDGEPR